MLYREIAREMSARNVDFHDEVAAERIAQSLEVSKLLNGSVELTNYSLKAAEVAALSKVRQALMGIQRQFAKQPPGAVLDGRDIGTVVCPDADVKIFVTATPTARARRRTLELISRGEDVKEEAVLADILRRDERDRSRAAAPLKRAEDAHELDTTHLNVEAAVAAAIDIIEKNKRR